MRALNNLLQTSKKDKGVAGLTVLLSVVTMLFVIGLLIMIFSLMGGELDDATDTTTAGGDVVDYEATNSIWTNASYVPFVNSTILGLEDVVCSLYNFTNSTGAELIGSGNYTLGTGLSTCYAILNNGTAWDGSYNGSQMNATYSFTYSEDTTASGVITNTTTALTTVPEWFPIIVVITAMVVLILLTVVIISAIKGSGLVAGGGRYRGGSGSA